MDIENIENSEEKILDPHNLGGVVPHSLEGEIKKSYIEYAMSVIVSRALPDTRDGFKPVLRRIIYAMYDMKMLHNSKHKKSARIVGEVLGKYHPHGDSSVYEAMARMAQSWSLRYPLVDGQGNFGSIDGDSPAAMRYTEARLTKIAEEMCSDIEQETIDMRDNFDGSLKEPIMLPTKFPNHLCNGTMGIAVGMATNMAPHNLIEIIDAVLLLLYKEGKITQIVQESGDIEDVKYVVSIDEIMDIIKGPDFPTGGYIYDSNNIKEVYKKGRGGIVMRGKTRLENHVSGQILIITEIPYMVNKSTLVAKIGELVVNKRIDGIVDIRDETSKDKIRIAIYLKKDVDPDTILIQLYKYTDLQCNFNVNNVSLIDRGSQPRLMNIKDLLVEFLSFRRQTIYRRSVYQLNKAKDRLHILEGLKKAIDIIDAVISTIRNSQTKQEAKDKLINDFGFSSEQSEYILMMRLQSLVGLEIQKVLEEIEDKQKLIEYLESIIANPSKLDEIVEEELNYMKNKFGDERRTILSEDTSVYNLSGSLKEFKDAEDRIKEDVIVWLGHDYSMKVLYQTRIQVIPEETIDLVYTHNQDKLIIITDRGELVVQRIKDFGQFTTQGKALDIKKHFELKGNIVFAKTLHFHYEYLVFLTNQNSIKKIDKNLILSFKKFPTVIMGLKEKEKIVSIKPVNNGDHLGVVTEGGWMLLFSEEDVRPMGKTSGGVKAIELQDGDRVSNMFLHKDEPFILVHGYKTAKLLSLEDLRFWRRGKKGQVVVLGNDKIAGGIGIIEGAIRIRFADGDMKTIHSNDVHLDMPESSMKKIVDKNIDMIYRPREEIEENLKYKDEKKTMSDDQIGLFEDSKDTDLLNSEDDLSDEESQEIEE